MAAAVVAAGLALSSAASVRAQLTFGSGVELVRLPVTVTRGNSFVTDLAAEDFRIYEDGVLQEIDSFTRSSAPLTLVLLLDISGSMEDRLIQVQMAATRFIRALRPDDRVQVAQFKDRVSVLADFTNDHAALEAAIKKTAAYGATALHNALYTAIRNLRPTDPTEVRRRAIVVLSDGDDTASIVGEDQVLDFARRSEVAIYAIALESWQQRGRGGAVDLLQVLAHETGGQLLLADSVGELESMYARIAEELRTQYTLGYGSTAATSRNRWRRIDVRIASRKGLQVRHRIGYYAGRGGATAPVAPPPAETKAASTGGAVPAEVDGAAPAAATEEPPPEEWMSVEEGTLRMQLAHAESDRSDRGSLVVDPAARQLRWEPGEGPDACPRGFELSFDEIAAVAAAPDVGLVLRVDSDPPRAIQFVPAPFGEWLPAAPGLKSSALPGRLRVETRVAVRSLLEALGRAPTADEEALYAFYGPPVSVDLHDLLRSPGEYEGRTVRVRGVFDATGGRYALRSGRTVVEVTEDYEYVIPLSAQGDASLSLSPLRDIRAFVASRALQWDRQSVEVLGVFRREAVGEGGNDISEFGLKFWQVRAPEVEGARVLAGRPVRLDALIDAAGGLDGEVVRVAGLFRGGNLYGDLPGETRRNPGDWVIKHGRASIWVTGKAPEGDGWKLDRASTDDGRAWLEVVGRPRTIKGMTYLSAMDVAPATAPSRDASAAPTSKSVRVYGPPVVTFALPGEGDVVPSDARFVLQFSNPLDAASLPGHVELRYVDAPEAAFGQLRVTYSDRARHIVVDPGEPLQSGRTLECRLLSGIVDFEGQALVPRQGDADGEVVDVFRFEVGS